MYTGNNKAEYSPTASAGVMEVAGAVLGFVADPVLVLVGADVGVGVGVEAGNVVLPHERRGMTPPLRRVMYGHWMGSEGCRWGVAGGMTMGLG